MEISHLELAHRLIHLELARRLTHLELAHRLTHRIVEQSSKHFGMILPIQSISKKKIYKHLLTKPSLDIRTALELDKK